MQLKDKDKSIESEKRRTVERTEDKEEPIKQGKKRHPEGSQPTDGPNLTPSLLSTFVEVRY